METRPSDYRLVYESQMLLRIATLVALLAGSALADTAKRIEVAVEATVEVDAGRLIGFRCDDPKLIDGRMTTKQDARGEHNVLVIKGVAPGKTLCRIGTDPLMPFVLFDVVVIDKPRR